MAYHKEYYVYVCRDKVIRIEFALVSRGCSSFSSELHILNIEETTDSSFEYIYIVLIKPDYQV